MTPLTAVKKPTSITSLWAKQFEMIKPLKREDIPSKRGRPTSSLYDLKVFKEFGTLLGHIKTSGISPFEVVGEIDTNEPTIQAEKTKRKSFTQAFRTILKDCLEEYELTDVIEIREYNHGEKFFIVGKTVAA